ncbi:hypothetical protein [Actinoplanes xinjiangensis]|uniref:hypothetical protein n=1 Tax=Actinoplanes xinjiangensis TaxID=512350 RepID=UPI00344547EF
MGTSYQTILVAAEFAATVQAVQGTGARAIVVPVAAERVAVIPEEGDWDVADLGPLAEDLSAALSRPVLATYVVDSDFVDCHVYRGGAPVHRYVSDQSMLVEWFEGDDGVIRPGIGGVAFPPGHALPEGALGADADAFAPFATAEPDLARIGAALRGQVAPDRDRIRRQFAEAQHTAIIAALGLPPQALTVAYRHTDPAYFPGAVLV